jgi:hypothetical protein
MHIPLLDVHQLQMFAGTLTYLEPKTFSLIIFIICYDDDDDDYYYYYLICLFVYFSVLMCIFSSACL